MTPQRGWSLPPSITNPPLGIKPWAIPRLRCEPPRFDGENAPDWIRKIQKYYNHHYTPLDDRLYLTQYLFDHPASDWREYWVETNKGKGWDDFLLDVKQQFDPEFYEPYTATSSFEPFRSTRGTSRDQRQPKRTTANPVANQKPDSQPLHRIEEIKHTVIVVKEHNADGDHIDQTCCEALHKTSEIIVGDDIKGVGYDMDQAAQVQALTETILPRDGSTDPVHEDVVNKSVPPDLGAQSGVAVAIMSSSLNANSLCETDGEEAVLPTWDSGASVGDSCFETIEEHHDEFCGNDGNLVANTPFVEKKVLEFNVLDVCFDGAEGLRVENGITDLVCDNKGLKDCCSGDFCERHKFHDELHDSVGEASMSSLGGTLIERQCCHLTRLLPFTLEELTGYIQHSSIGPASTGPSLEVTAHYSKKWPTSNHLTAPATGAVLNTSIDFSIIDGCSLEPDYFAKIPNIAKEGGLDHLFDCDISRKCYFNNLGSVPLMSLGGSYPHSQSQHLASPIYAFDKLKEVSYSPVYSFSSTTTAKSPIWHSNSELYANVVHEGDTSKAGHYYSFIRLHSTEWYISDDSRVSAADGDEVFEQMAYILLYAPHSALWFNDFILALQPSNRFTSLVASQLLSTTCELRQGDGSALNPGKEEYGSELDRDNMGTTLPFIPDSMKWCQDVSLGEATGAGGTDKDQRLPCAKSKAADVDEGLIAGEYYRFASRQLLFLCIWLDLFDVLKRKAAMVFFHVLLHTTLVDDLDEVESNVIIDDGFNSEEETSWFAVAAADLCENVHVISREFEELILHVVNVAVHTSLCMLEKPQARLLATHNKSENWGVQTDLSLSFESTKERVEVQSIDTAGWDAREKAAAGESYMALSHTHHIASPLYAFVEPKEVHDFLLISFKSTFKQHFPDLRLEDKAIFEGGGVDRDSIVKQPPLHIIASPAKTTAMQADPTAKLGESKVEEKKSVRPKTARYSGQDLILLM